MAVEASGRTLFHPQMMITNSIDNQPNANTSVGYGIDNPLMYCSNAFSLKAESCLTCSLPVSRKRQRDPSDMNNALLSFFNNQHMNQNPIRRCEPYTFLGEDFSLQIQQQQLEINHIIAYQTEKVRVDVEERRKRNSMRIIVAVEEGFSNRLREKEEEIMKISKLNWALEEKVKSLCVENQIWRELAQTNEATANALRRNLKQVLDQVVQDEHHHRSTTACVEEDAQSCCESNNDQDDCSNRLCKKCGQGESCVLLLPCRHLCLCTGCASSVNTCPICKSTKNISVHVNIS